MLNTQIRSCIWCVNYVGGCLPGSQCGDVSIVISFLPHGLARDALFSSFRDCFSLMSVCVDAVAVMFIIIPFMGNVAHYHFHDFAFSNTSLCFPENWRQMLSFSGPRSHVSGVYFFSSSRDAEHEKR